MTKLIICLLLVFLNLVVTNVIFGDTKTGAVILKQIFSARAESMGNAFTGIADDINSVFYNPAGLISVKSKELLAGYVQTVGDTNIQVVSITKAFDQGILHNKETLAFSICSLQSGIIEVNLTDPDDTFRETKLYQAEKDYLVIVSYARKFGETISAGTNIKLIQSTLVEMYSAIVSGFDIGLLYKKNNLGLGLCLQNIGQEIKYKEVGDPLPLNMRIGAGVTTPFGLVAVDFISDLENEIKLNLGTEYRIKDIIMLRLGYKIWYDLDTFSFGLGINWKYIKFDFGLSLLSRFNYTYRTNVIFQF